MLDINTEILNRPTMYSPTLEELQAIATQETAELLFEVLREHPELEARTEQAETLDAIQEARVLGAEKALVQMATGLGN